MSLYILYICAQMYTVNQGFGTCAAKGAYIYLRYPTRQIKAKSFFFYLYMISQNCIHEEIWGKFLVTPEVCSSRSSSVWWTVSASAAAVARIRCSRSQTASAISPRSYDLGEAVWDLEHRILATAAALAENVHQTEDDLHRTEHGMLSRVEENEVVKLL